MKTILILVLTLALSGCVANRFINNKTEFKEKVFSKINIPLNNNYEKIAKCWADSYDGGHPDLHIFGELGLAEWSLMGEFRYYWILITFERKSADETLAGIYTIVKDGSVYSSVMIGSISDIEPILKKCAG